MGGIGRPSPLVACCALCFRFLGSVLGGPHSVLRADASPASGNRGGVLLVDGFAFSGLVFLGLFSLDAVFVEE